MGLDMYLYGKIYLSKLDKKEAKQAETIRQMFGMYKSGNLDSVEVSFEIGYWRKANQIHSWFVTNCQNGRDECQESYVSREKLESLRELCQQALASKKPEILLPTKSGFFFGSTDVDEYYRQDLEHTIKVIDQALKLSEDFTFAYHSSW